MPRQFPADPPRGQRRYRRTRIQVGFSHEEAERIITYAGEKGLCLSDAARKLILIGIVGA